MERHKIVETTQEHIDYIAQNIRKPDRDELWATCLQKPEAAMLRGFQGSEVCLTAMVDDTPLCVWGVMPDSMIFKSGTPWMVASNDLDREAVIFIRNCKPEVMSLFDKYDILENYVDARNTRSIQWLKWLGFTIEKAKPYGILNKPFHRFWMEKAYV